jgi:hypothetical protein
MIFGVILPDSAKIKSEEGKPKMKMQGFKRLMPTVAVAVLTIFALGCSGSMAATETENVHVDQVLLQSGFKSRPANTPAKRKQLRALPENEFTTVKQNGNTYYLFPDKKNNRLYVGDHYAYRAYQNFFKNRKLRAKGVAVFPIHPANKSSNTTVQVWEQWSPFDQWK